MGKFTKQITNPIDWTADIHLNCGKDCDNEDCLDDCKACRSLSWSKHCDKT